MRLHATFALHIIAFSLALLPSIAAACSFGHHTFYAEGAAPECVIFHETSSYSGPYQIRVENRCEDGILVRCEETECVDLALAPGEVGNLPYTEDYSVAAEGVPIFWRVGRGEERTGLLRLGPLVDPCADSSLLCASTPGQRSGPGAGLLLVLCCAMRWYRAQRPG